jgi:hypothetical protein
MILRQKSIGFSRKKSDYHGLRADRQAKPVDERTAKVMTVTQMCKLYNVKSFGLRQFHAYIIRSFRWKFVTLQPEMAYCTLL